jgi:hypothetical protein
VAAQSEKQTSLPMRYLGRRGARRDLATTGHAISSLDAAAARRVERALVALRGRLDLAAVALAGLAPAVLQQ